VLTENQIPLQTKRHTRVTAETVPWTRHQPRKHKVQNKNSAWSEVSKAVTTSKGRREFIDFIRNGFKLNRSNSPD
jgi:hypothetical protein